jgi:hypothetical protein
VVRAGGVYTPFDIDPALGDQFTAELTLPVPWTVATHWDVWSSVIRAGVQETDTEVIDGTATVIVAEPEIEPDLAVIVALPTFAAVTIPPVVMVAIVVSDEFHVALALRSCVVPLLKLPVAASCFVWPTPIVAVAGVTVTLVRVADGAEDDAPPPPQPPKRKTKKAKMTTSSTGFAVFMPTLVYEMNATTAIHIEQLLETERPS